MVWKGSEQLKVKQRLKDEKKLGDNFPKSLRPESTECIQEVESRYLGGTCLEGG